MNDEKEGNECITIALIPAYNPCGCASFGYTTEQNVVVRDEDEEVLEGHVVLVQLIMV